jgi:hypothetical protein
MANVAVNATISARDAASGNINKVNKSLKALQFGFAAAGIAAAALAKFAFDAVKAAAEDEMSNARLNAALKARGLLTDDLASKVKEQTAAMAALGITDDQVRAGIEVGSRFFADQTTILQANSVAADVAAVTGASLADVVESIGKGAQGQLKGLRALGVQVNKGATAQDILTAISAKYSGIADEIANTTGGKYLAAQVSINEKMEEFGYKLLPTVNDALEFMTETVLPALETQLGLIGTTLDNTVDNHFDPFKEAVAEFSQLFGTGGEGLVEFGNERYWSNFFKPLNDALDKARVAIEIFNEAYKFFLRLTGQPIPGFVPGSDPMNDRYGGVRGTVQLGTGGMGAGGATTVTTTVNIGTEKVDTVVSQALRRIGPGGRNQ